MNDDVRRAALRQAARVAGMAGALACSPTSTQEARVEPLPTATATATETAAQAHLPSPAPSCAIALDADGGIVKGSIDCCLAATRVGASTKDGGVREPLDWKATRPDLVQCCHAIASKGRLAYVLYEQGWDQQACFGCEEVLGERGACTPWGPPMPPPMV
jgi:hypothetical protein